MMPEHEFRDFFCLLVAAGNDTTRYSIAAGLQALCHQPELLGQMQAGGIWDTAPDEIMRWATPALYFRRTATRDFDCHGKTIRQGDKVLYWFASGNRDDAVFEDPFRVNLARTPNRHLSFGQGGPHVCIGMWLARPEVRVLFEELAKRLRSIEPAGDHKFLRSNFVGGSNPCPSASRCNRGQACQIGGGPLLRHPAPRTAPRLSISRSFSTTMSAAVADLVEIARPCRKVEVQWNILLLQEPVLRQLAIADHFNDRHNRGRGCPCNGSA